jgi:anaerobic magnesium-protoporphyrin IX monomethyl ester cyclase
MHDITLIHVSPLPITEDAFVERYLKQIPLGLLSLATYLTSQGFRVDLRDYVSNVKGDPLQIDTFFSFLGEPEKAVGLSTLSVSLPYVLLITEELKRRYPKLKIILGGLGPSLVAEGLMNTFPFIDHIICGEGEIPLLHALSNDFSSPEATPGLFYRNAGRLCQNPPARIEDLDILPIADYSLIDIASYPDENAHIVTMRGCPYGCAFCCCSQYWGRRTTLRSLDSVMEEIRILVHRYGIRTIHIEDDTFVINRSRVLEFCRKIEQEQIKGLRWSSMARVDLIDEELLRAMAGSGCYSLYFGLESGSETVRFSLEGKGFTNREALEKLRMARHYMEEVIASFLWGFPVESLDHFLETIKFICYLEEQETCTTRLSLVIPFPGTLLFQRYRSLLKYSDDIINHKMRYYVNDTIRHLILSYPHLFSAFYHFDSPDMIKKQRFFERFLEKQPNESTAH